MFRELGPADVDEMVDRLVANEPRGSMGFVLEPAKDKAGAWRAVVEFVVRRTFISGCGVMSNDEFFT